MESPRAWWGVGLVRHAGHTEAVLQQRQLIAQNHQEGEESKERKEGDNEEAAGRRTGEKVDKRETNKHQTLAEETHMGWESGSGEPRNLDQTEPELRSLQLLEF